MPRRRARGQPKPGDLPANAASIPGFLPVNPSYVAPEIPVFNLPTDPTHRYNSLRQIIQQNGSWFIQGLDLASRYYSRQPGDDMVRSNTQNNDPVDLLLVIKDVHRINRDQLVPRLVQAIQNSEEYSYDFDQQRRAHRRLHTNDEGSVFLQDFDYLIEMLRQFRQEFDESDRSRAAADLLGNLIRAKGYDTVRIIESGLQHEWLRYASSWFLARLRFMNQYLVRTGEFRRNRRQRPWDEGTIRLLMNEMNMRLHGSAFREDLRAVEWFTLWADLFNRYEREPRNRQPRLDPETAMFMFEKTYCISYVNGLKMAKHPLFAVDIQIIDDWIEYKDKVESLFRFNQNSTTARWHESHYLQWVEQLNESLVRWDGIDISTYARDEYNNTLVPRRQAFTDFIDQNAKNIYSGRGRWCTSAPPLPGQNIGFNQEAKDPLKRYTEGWYCIEHRPRNQCLSCGWEFRCAMCSNPHTCVNCQTPYNCVTCGVLSYDPARDDATYTYQVEGAAPFPSQVEDGVYVTPRRYITPLNQGQFGPVPVGGFAGNRVAPRDPNRDNMAGVRPPSPPRTPAAPAIDPNAMDIDSPPGGAPPGAPVPPGGPTPPPSRPGTGPGPNNGRTTRGPRVPQPPPSPTPPPPVRNQPSFGNQNPNRVPNRNRGRGRGRGRGGQVVRGGRVVRRRTGFGPQSDDDDDDDDGSLRTWSLRPVADPGTRVTKAGAGGGGGGAAAPAVVTGRDWRVSEEALQRAIAAASRNEEGGEDE
ncbi:hypothetical protein F5B20DRAFT_314245 [Whalleya microplaca]|nr:hypothetical protein F5B20DRAFT_314245 [Whalleya microplaca]